MPISGRTPIIIKQRNTLPHVKTQLLGTDGAFLHMNVGDQAFFNFGTQRQLDARNRGEAVTIPVDNGVVTVTPDVTGDWFEYPWLATDTDVPPGDYLCEFEIVYANGDRETFPNDKSIPITVVAAVGV